MIQAYKFKKIKNIQNVLTSMEGYIIESELDNLFYIFIGDELAIVRNSGGIRCNREDIPRLLPMLCDSVRYELKMILKDIAMTERIKGCGIWGDTK